MRLRVYDIELKRGLVARLWFIRLKNDHYCIEIQTFHESVAIKFQINQKLKYSTLLKILKANETRNCTKS